MRRTLGPLLLATLFSSLFSTGLLTGCGTDGAASPRGSSPSSSREPGSVKSMQVALFSRSAAGGEVDERAVVLDGAAAVHEFVGRFRTDAMRQDVREAVASTDVPAGMTLVGAVVAVGCDVPSGVTVQSRDDGVALVPLEPTTTHRECLVAVTTVALMLVGSAAVRG